MKHLFLFVAVALGTIANAQSLKTPAKSPMSTTKQAVGLSEITVEYSRPSKNNRVIFGDLVPYGEVWRTGANASTKITFGEDVSINGQAVKAGTYALYTIPGENEWTIIFNKNLTLWGSDGYTESEDLIRVLVKVQKLAENIETFTIQYSNIKPTALNIDLMWDKVKVSLDLSVSVDDKIMKNIEATMAQDKRPYFQAAQYYYDNKKDYKQALEWATKAFELNPNAYWACLLKAKLQFELKDMKGAKASAETVKKMAEADKDLSYAKQAEELLKQISEKK